MVIGGIAACYRYRQRQQCRRNEKRGLLAWQCQMVITCFDLNQVLIHHRIRHRQLMMLAKL